MAEAWKDVDATTAPETRRVRWMCQVDWPAVCRIEVRSFPPGDDWTRKDFQKCLAEMNCIGMVAEVMPKGPVIGYVLHELFETKLHLLRFAVHPGWRRQGVGALLVGKLTATLARGRRNRVTADVPESNLGACNFLAGMGFRAVRVLRGQFGSEDGYRFVYRRRGE